MQTTKTILKASNGIERALARHQMEYLIYIAQTAHRLEKLLKTYVGDNDEWPIRIKCDNDKLSFEVAGRLNDLNVALIPFRQEHMEENSIQMIMVEGKALPYPGPLFEPPSNAD